MNRTLLSTAICGALLVAGAGIAQAAQPAAGPQPQDANAQSKPSPEAKKKETQKPQVLSTVTVTGTLLKGPEYEGTVPVQEVPIKAQMAAGMNTVAQFIQTTAAAGGATQINGQFGGFILEGGTGVKPISLRGLGASRTLVLLDGQRPGPAGTGNQVNNFDLNVIPTAVIQSVAVIKDGSSSIYGSDAIAGVVNLITKKNLGHPSFDFFAGSPQHGSGQEYSGSFADGWNFSKNSFSGNVTVAAQVDRQQAIVAGDRPFLDCSRPIVYGPNGKRIDLPDTSINAGTSMAGCNNLFVDAVIDLEPVSNEEASYPHFGQFFPNPSGATGPLSPVPGYFLGTCTNYINPNTGATEANPGCNAVQDFSKYGETYATVQNENETLWVAPSFSFNSPFGILHWDTQLLINRRMTSDFSWRQFFPIVAEQNGQSIAGTGTNGHLWEPVLLFPNWGQISVNYKYLRSSLSGGFGDSSWSWNLNVNASQSDGTNYLLGISKQRSGDNFNDTGNQIVGPTLLNYFDPSLIAGNDIQGYTNGSLVSAIGQPSTEVTFYKQQDANVLFQGDIPLHLPAGPIAAAVGGEFRHFTLDDRPGVATWEYSHSGPTEGTDSDKEFFGQVGIPIVKNVPGFNSLALTGSAREFKYNQVGSWARVWKYGLNWQIIPEVRIRGTIGTSYRAPALFQEFQAATTGFVSQVSIDPCVDWVNSTSANVRANCKAAGIPNDYNGGGVSAAVFTQGGGKALQSETSRAKSLGVVWSPEFANLEFAVDYFDYHIFNEVTQIGAFDIVQSCYNRPVFPNEFCTLFHRNPPGATPNSPGANNITTVQNPWINLNQERDRGYDFQWNYQRDFGFGHFTLDGETTYLITHTQNIFSTTAASGFSTNNFTGSIGNPRWYGIFDAALSRGNWTYNWQGIFVSRTDDHNFVDATENYLGIANAHIVIKAGAQFRQTLSAMWSNGTLGVRFGVRNIADAKPPQISSGDTNVNLLGNTPLQASQYDWYGRTWFARLTMNL